jgi:hypothetical protein
MLARAFLREHEGDPDLNANRILRLVLVAALGLGAVLARAAEREGTAGTVYPKAQYPYGELVKQPLTLAAGMIEVDIPVEVNLTKDELGKPWTIPAAADYSWSDDLQFGIFHQTGFCLASESNGCPKTYNDLGVRTRLGVHRAAGGQLVVQAGAMATSFSESLFDAYVGAAYKRTLGNLAVVLEGNLTSALNDRDVVRELRVGGIRTAQYREAFLSRAELQLQLIPGLAAVGRIGYSTSLEEPTGTDLPWLVPVAVGVEYEIYPRIGIGAEFTFENLLGKDASADERSGVIFARLFL